MSRKAKVSLQTANDTVQQILRQVELFQTVTQNNFARISALVAHIPEIETRLSSVEEQMKSVGVRLENLEGLYQHLDRKLEILDEEYFSITAALKRLEERFDKREAGQLRDRVRILEERVTALEKSIVN